ncbi:MAG: rRNA methylase [Planctomycetaceae bacterium]|nr:rRNA methylase [Planctomycetaceae bacterium]
MIRFLAFVLGNTNLRDIALLRIQTERVTLFEISDREKRNSIMPVIPLTDLNDPRLDVYRHLKQTNQTRWEQIFIAEGEKLVERLLESDFETLSLLSAETHVARLLPRVPENVPVYTVASSDIDQLIGFNFHRGVLACGRRKPNPPLESLWQNASGRLLLVLCPDIKDPENLGAILRISAAFGVDGVIVGREGTDPYSRRVLRVSMGTVFRLPVIQVDEWGTVFAALRSENIETAATVLDSAAEPLFLAKRPARFALAFGCEGHGLPSEFVVKCDRRVTIQMANGVDSLNVSVAAGIFLHHFA